MKTRVRSLFLLLVALGGSMTLAYSQISEIKSFSGRPRGGGERYLGSGAGAYLLFDLLANGAINWQTKTLRKKEQVPTVVSIEAMLHIASQPSRYYILNPRIRLNWGIFLTDFRVNYMLEQVPGGFVDMRTNDWQVLGLNLIQQPTFNLRMSTGIMTEKFGNNNIFSESVVGAQWRSVQGKTGAAAEYRWARDYSEFVTARKEISTSLLRTVARTPHFDLALTIGAVYQLYYSEITVWGVQGGIYARVY
jgi:hypothetical protein